MDRRNFLKNLGIAGAGAAAGEMPIASSGEKLSQPSAPGRELDGELADIGFMAKEILNFYPLRDEFYQRRRDHAIAPEEVPASMVIPFGGEPVSLYVTKGSDHDPPPEPKIQPLLDDLRSDRHERIEAVCRILWETARLDLIETIKAVTLPYPLEKTYRQVDFLPRRRKSFWRGSEVKFGSSRIVTPRYVCDVAEVNNYTLADLLGSVKDLAIEAMNLLHNSAATVGRDHPVPQNHLFFEHTPARTVVGREGWMVEIYHHFEMCGAFTSWPVT